MKIRFKIPRVMDPDHGFRVTLPAKVAAWWKPTKVDKAIQFGSVRVFTKADFENPEAGDPTNELTLYLEAKDYSTSMRDLSIDAKLIGADGATTLGQETVVATAFWATAQTSFAGEWIPWTDMPQIMKDELIPTSRTAERPGFDGTGVRFNPLSPAPTPRGHLTGVTWLKTQTQPDAGDDTGLGVNSIAYFRWTIHPTDFKWYRDQEVKIDIARRTNARLYTYSGSWDTTNKAPIAKQSWPTQNELPNDDTFSYDERFEDDGKPLTEQRRQVWFDRDIPGSKSPRREPAAIGVSSSAKAQRKFSGIREV